MAQNSRAALVTATLVALLFSLNSCKHESPRLDFDANGRVRGVENLSVDPTDGRIVPDGLQYSFDSSGLIQDITTYKMGKQLGPQWRYDHGNTVSIQYFGNDGVDSTVYFSTANAQSKSYFSYLDGAITRKIDFEYGPAGILRTWHSSSFDSKGNLIQESRATFGPSGDSLTRTDYIFENKRVKDGTSTVWDSSGKTVTPFR